MQQVQVYLADPVEYQQGSSTQMVTGVDEAKQVYNQLASVQSTSEVYVDAEMPQSGETPEKLEDEDL